MEFFADHKGLSSIQTDTLAVIELAVIDLLKKSIPELVTLSKHRLDVKKGLVPGHIQAEPKKVLDFLEKRDKEGAEWRKQEQERQKIAEAKAAEKKKKKEEAMSEEHTRALAMLENKTAAADTNDMAMMALGGESIDFRKKNQQSSDEAYLAQLGAPRQPKASGGAAAGNGKSGAKVARSRVDDLAGLKDRRYTDKNVRVEDVVCMLEGHRQFRRSKLLYTQYLQMDSAGFQKEVNKMNSYEGDDQHDHDMENGDG